MHRLGFAVRGRSDRAHLDRVHLERVRLERLHREWVQLDRLRQERVRLERLLAGHALGPGALLPPPAHLSLRDSRTLNLALAPPEPVGRAHLVLSRGRVRYELPLAVERPGGGRLFTVTATLRGPGAAAGAAGLRLADGVWRLTVVTTGPEGRVRHRGIAVDPDQPLPLTPTVRHAPDPDSGALIRVVRCPSGRAALQVTRAGPHAELVRFEPRGDGAAVHGRLVAAPLDGWRARAVRRRDGVAVPAQLSFRGAEFTLDLPFGSMTGAGPGQWVWDVRLSREPGRVRAARELFGDPGDRELTLGRRLTDVHDPAAAFPTPYRVFALPCGSLVRARAYVTTSGAFAVACLDLTEGS
ncbi:hypothetical protein [Streptomyces boluensis]|uniref:Uncharacterized protein n=1 Tax=Streptomyces boluensis TaxID=1775135 RepID=A0A964XLL7_9ACTN|nr:hypothetical protein [Streptomyces boluensis]NBE53604.1 hypothetical protein [Streptomyces boluensis]